MPRFRLPRCLLPICLLLLSLSASGQQPEPLEAERLYQQAWFAETADGDLESALLLYQRVLATHAEHPEIAGRAALRSGVCLQRLQRAEDAREAYRQATLLLPDGPEATLAQQHLAALLDPTPAASQAVEVWQIALLPPGFSVEQPGLTILAAPWSRAQFAQAVDAWVAQHAQVPAGVELTLFGDASAKGWLRRVAELKRSLARHGCELRSVMTRSLDSWEAPREDRRALERSPAEIVLPQGAQADAPKLLTAGQPLFLLAGALERCLGCSIDVDPSVAHLRAAAERAGQTATALELLQSLARELDLTVRPTPTGYRLAPSGDGEPPRWLSALPAFEAPLAEVARMLEADVEPGLAALPVTWLSSARHARPELAATLGLELGLAGQRYLLRGTPPSARTYPQVWQREDGCELYAYRDRLADVVGALGELVEVAPDCADLPVSLWTQATTPGDIVARLLRFYPSLRLVQADTWQRLELADSFEEAPSPVSWSLHEDGSFDLRCEAAPLFRLLEALDRLGPVAPDDLWGRPWLRHVTLPSQSRWPISLDLRGQDLADLPELLARERVRIDAQGGVTVSSGSALELEPVCALRPRPDGLYDVHIQRTPLGEVLDQLAELGCDASASASLRRVPVDFERHQLSPTELVELLGRQLRLEVSERRFSGFGLLPRATLGEQLTELEALDPFLRVAVPGTLQAVLIEFARVGPAQTSVEALEALARLADAEVEHTLEGFRLRLLPDLIQLQAGELVLRCEATTVGDVVAELRRLLAPASIELAPGLAELPIPALELQAETPRALLDAFASSQSLRLGKIGGKYRLDGEQPIQLAADPTGTGTYNVLAENAPLADLLNLLVSLGSEHLYLLEDAELGTLRVSVDLRRVTPQEAIDRTLAGYGVEGWPTETGRIGLQFAKLRLDAVDVPLPKLLAQLGLAELRLAPGLDARRVSLSGNFKTPRDALRALGLRLRAAAEPGDYDLQPQIPVHIRRTSRPGGVRVVPVQAGGWALLLGSDASEADCLAALRDWSASWGASGLVVDVFGAPGARLATALHASGLLWQQHESTLPDRRRVPEQLGLPELVRASREIWALERSQRLPICVWLGQLEAALSPRVLRYTPRAGEQPWAGRGQKDTPLSLLREIGVGASLLISTDSDEVVAETHAAAPVGWVELGKPNQLVAFDAPLAAVMEALAPQLGNLVLAGGLSELRLSIVSQAQRSPSEHLDHIASMLGLRQELSSNLILLEGVPDGRPDVRLLDEAGLLSMFCYRQPLAGVLAELAASRPGLEIRYEPQASDLPVTFYGERLSLEEIIERLAWMYGLQVEPLPAGLRVTADAVGVLDPRAPTLAVHVQDIALSWLAALLSAQTDERFELEPDLELRIETLNLSGLTAREIASAAAEALRLQLEQTGPELYTFRRGDAPQTLPGTSLAEAPTEVLLRAYPDGRALKKYRAGSCLVVELGIDALWSLPEAAGLPVNLELQPGVALDSLPGIHTQLAAAGAQRVRSYSPLQLRLAEGSAEQRLATLQGLADRLRRAELLGPSIDVRGLNQAELRRVQRGIAPADESVLQRALAGTRAAGFDAVEQAWRAGDLERVGALLRQTRQQLVAQQLDYLELAAFRSLADGRYALRSPLHREDLAQLRELLAGQGPLRIAGVLPEGADVEAFDALPGPDGQTLRLEHKGALVVEQALFARAVADADGARIEVLLSDADGARLEELSRRYRGAQLAIIVDGRVVSAPTVQTTIAGGRFWVTGAFDLEEAEQLAELFRHPALPLQVTFE